MESRDFAPNHRKAVDLLHAVPETEALDHDEGLILDDPSRGQAAGTLRQTAESAVHFLVNTSVKPAVLLVRSWHVLGIPFAYEHMNLYQEVAAASKCFIVAITRPEAGGEEHLLFVARVSGLTDEQYLACIEPTTPLDPAIAGAK